jgi:moderate conductance mechanosensitive channel
VGSLISIAVIIAIAAVVWEFTSSAIARYLASQDTNGASVERSARIRTLLPLLRNAFLVFLIGVVGLTVWPSSASISRRCWPAPASSAWPSGSAARRWCATSSPGCSSSSRTRFRWARWSLSGHTGIVEAMSIRAVRLRDLSGSVHTVPWSDVTSVVNLTKDYSYYTMDIGVAYREDVDMVIETIREIGADLQADPTSASTCWSPSTSWGSIPSATTRWSSRPGSRPFRSSSG